MAALKIGDKKALIIKYSCARSHDSLHNNDKWLKHSAKLHHRSSTSRTRFYSAKNWSIPGNIFHNTKHLINVLDPSHCLTVGCFSISSLTCINKPQTSPRTGFKTVMRPKTKGDGRRKPEKKRSLVSIRSFMLQVQTKSPELCSKIISQQEFVAVLENQICNIL